MLRWEGDQRATPLSSGQDGEGQRGRAGCPCRGCGGQPEQWPCSSRTCQAVRTKDGQGPSQKCSGSARTSTTARLSLPGAQGLGRLGLHARHRTRGTGRDTACRHVSARHPSSKARQLGEAGMQAAGGLALPYCSCSVRFTRRLCLERRSLGLSGEPIGAPWRAW